MTRRVRNIVAHAAAGLVLIGAAAAALASEQGSSFDCSGVEDGSIGELVCTVVEPKP